MMAFFGAGTLPDGPFWGEVAEDSGLHGQWQGEIGVGSVGGFHQQNWRFFVKFYHPSVWMWDIQLGKNDF